VALAARNPPAEKELKSTLPGGGIQRQLDKTFSAASYHETDVLLCTSRIA